ncbi:recombinase family protein [Bradyrhizobium sp. CCGB12]|uniref:recombinase family protein n=1 Tax=Bradyrhizobium sp. CCGB12 TaxID=2949632 RepID=UPI0020B1CD20|nr:recombinase family protein [Bradyrhizobium sp. CCGB12]MCP3392087.1 recombinase family protein [Bradyrhizobium sp. CCGB12]
MFADYLAGKSSRTIAFELNREGGPGPQEAKGGSSTVHGNPKRGVGILNNEIYVGRPCGIGSASRTRILESAFLV